MGIDKEIINNVIIEFNNMIPNINMAKDFVKACYEEFNLAYYPYNSFEDFMDNGKPIFTKYEAIELDKISDRIIEWCKIKGIDIEKISNDIQNKEFNRRDDIDESEINMDGDLSSFKIEENSQPIQNNKFRTDKEVRDNRNKLNQKKAALKKKYDTLDNAIGAQKVWQVDALKENKNIHKNLNKILLEDVYFEPKKNDTIKKVNLSDEKVSYLEQDLNEMMNLGTYMDILYIYRVNKYLYKIVLRSENGKINKKIYLNLDLNGQNLGPENVTDEMPPTNELLDDVLCWDYKESEEKNSVNNFLNEIEDLDEIIAIDNFLCSGNGNPEQFMNEIENI